MPANGRKLLEGNGGACLFESSLCLLGGFLACTLEDGLGSAIDDSLGLAKTQRGELADGLDDLDLLLADALEDDGEGVLLLNLFSGGSGARSGCSSNRSSGGDLEGLLECLSEVADLDEGQALELVEQLFC